MTDDTAQPSPRYHSLGWHELLRDRTFILMWLAMLVSTMGAFLLLLALAVLVLERTGSGLLASGVFAAQWLLPILCVNLVGYIVNRLTPRTGLIIFEMITALFSLAIGFVAQSHLWLLFIILAFRGLGENITKSIRLVGLKRGTRPELLERASSVFHTAQYLGSGLGGAVGSFFVGRFSIDVIAWTAGACSLFAAIVYALLRSQELAEAKPAAAPTLRVWREVGITMAQDRNLFRAFSQLVLVTGAFQGFHTVARTVLPIAVLGLAADSVTLLQVLASVAITAAAVFVGLFMRKGTVLYCPAPPLIVATSFSVVAAVYLPSPAVAFAAYTIFIFLFEVSFTRCANDVVIACPPERIGYVSAAQQSLLVFGMTIAVLAIGYSADAIGLQKTGIVVAGASIAATLVIDIAAGRLPLSRFVSR